MEPMLLGDRAVPGQIRRFDPEVAPPISAAVHPGPRADMVAVVGAWDAAMAEGSAPAFYDLAERERRASQADDMAAWWQAYIAEHGEPNHPQMERRFVGEVRFRLRGETYGILHGRALFDGQPQDGMIVVLVHRPEGWLVTGDLSGSQAIARALTVLEGEAAQPAAAGIVDHDLAERPWPTEGEALLDEAVTLFTAGDWLADVAMNRLAQPAHLPVLERALGAAGETDDDRRVEVTLRALLRINNSAALRTLAAQSTALRPHADLVKHRVATLHIGDELLPLLEELSGTPADRDLHGAFTRSLARFGDGQLWTRLRARLEDGDLDNQQLEAVAEGLALSMVRANDAVGAEALHRMVCWWGDQAVVASALRLLGRDVGGDAMLAALLEAGLSGREGALPILEAVLRRATPDVVRGRDRFIDELVPYLGQEHGEVRWLAAELLAASGDGAALAHVASHADREPVEPLRRRMQDLAAQGDHP